MMAKGGFISRIQSESAGFSGVVAAGTKGALSHARAAGAEAATRLPVRGAALDRFGRAGRRADRSGRETRAARAAWLTRPAGRAETVPGHRKDP